MSTAVDGGPTGGHKMFQDLVNAFVYFLVVALSFGVLSAFRGFFDSALHVLVPVSASGVGRGSYLVAYRFSYFLFYFCICIIFVALVTLIPF